MLKSIEIVEKTKPDIIDINYGCPVKKVVCKGAGAGILKDIPLMVKLTKEMVRKSKTPVTVKTRLGWDESSIKIVEVAERLQDVGIAAISIHGRTRSQMYKGRADWSIISDVKNNPRMKIPVFGNGDVDSPEAALEMKNKFGLDGAMIGRASIGNPWIFNQIKHYFKFGEKLKEPKIIDKIDLVQRHFEMSVKWKGPNLAIYETRKHYGRYFKGVENIKKFKIKLLSSNTVEEVIENLHELRENFNEPQLA
jgi:nifR3 family TIM-barrel protein